MPREKAGRIWPLMSSHARLTPLPACPGPRASYALHAKQSPPSLDLISPRKCHKRPDNKISDAGK